MTSENVLSATETGPILVQTEFSVQRKWRTIIISHRRPPIRFFLGGGGKGGETFSTEKTTVFKIDIRHTRIVSLLHDA